MDLYDDLDGAVLAGQVVLLVVPGQADHVLAPLEAVPGGPGGDSCCDKIS